MLTFLARCFIPDRENTASPAVRKAYGVLCGAVGIALNLLLFAGKFLAGQLSGSIAITADAFNNLSDAGSSLVTLLGFHLAGQKPDIHHPFGHGRMEYISGLAVSVLILLMGLELGKTSIEKILHPEPVDFSPLIFAILLSELPCKRLSKLTQTISALPYFISHVLLYAVCYGLLFCLLAVLYARQALPQLSVLSWPMLYAAALMGAVLSLRTRRAYMVLACSLGTLALLIWAGQKGLL